MVATLKGRDVLRITDMSSQEISALLNLSAQLKAGTLNPSCKKVLRIAILLKLPPGPGFPLPSPCTS